MADAATGEGVECGRITVWEPGERLTFRYRDTGGELDETEVDIRFEAVANGTRVTLEHRGWDALPDDVPRRRAVKQFGWTNILLWYSEWSFWGSPRRVAATQASAAGSSRDG